MAVVKDSKPSYWRDWTVFALRWLLIAATAVIIVLSRAQFEPFDIILNSIAIPLIAAAAANLIFGVFVFFPATHSILPYVMAVGDIVISGTLMYAAQGDPFLMLGVVVGLSALGLLRLSILFGTLQAVGVLVAAITAIVILEGANNVNALLPVYSVPGAIMFTLMLVVGIWAFMVEEHADEERKRWEKETAEKMSQITEMSKRATAVFHMANTLSSTLDFQKVLDAALNIGQTLRKNPHQRMVSMMLLFDTNKETLYVAGSRGLKHTDDHRTVYGREGVIARVLKEAMPIFGKDPAKDPELSTFSSLAGIRAVLGIPLRVGFDSYGVLVYGTDLPDAFNDEHMETLQAIGTQVTAALHNAQLYSNLMAERDRIIQLEEDARKEMARDLHDSPAQTIALVKMDIEIIEQLLKRDPEKVHQALQNVKERALKANEEIRHVLSSLYPLALETQGLIGALNQAANGMKSKHNQKVSMKLIPELEVLFNKQQQGVIYSLLTEAIENASKHAEAELVSVSAVRQSDTVLLTIADNGKGFDVDKALKNERGRYGLNNLYRRAESLDGVLDIQSQPGRGTRITLVIPIRSESWRNAPTESSRPVAATTRVPRR